MSRLDIEAVIFQHDLSFAEGVGATANVLCHLKKEEEEKGCEERRRGWHDTMPFISTDRYEGILIIIIKYHNSHTHDNDDDSGWMDPCMDAPTIQLPPSTHLGRDVGLAPDVEPSDDEVRIEDSHCCVQTVLGEFVAVDELRAGLGLRDGHQEVVGPLVVRGEGLCS